MYLPVHRNVGTPTVWVCLYVIYEAVYIEDNSGVEWKGV